MFNVATLAPVLQALFTTRADELAKQVKFVRRVREFTGGDFLSALAFGYLRRKDAPSSTSPRRWVSPARPSTSASPPPASPSARPPCSRPSITPSRRAATPSTC